MTRLVWDTVGERTFQNGVDAGVLYPESGEGVAWNGLVGVNESPDGGTATPYYIDGVQYYNKSTTEGYKATIDAFTYPDEFMVCDGTAEINSGLYITQQQRQSFGLSYRTRVGNDVDGTDLGFKIHFIYNALANPSQKPFKTLDDTHNAMTLSWDITATPIALDGFTPSAHFIVDSRKTNALLMAHLFDIIYGNDGAGPRLPLPSELVDIYNASYSTLVITSYPDGTWTADGDGVTLIDPTTFQIDADTAIFLDADSYTVETY